MADNLDKCTRFASHSVPHYIVTYTIDNSDSRIIEYIATVIKSDMTDSEDSVEVKTLANAEAGTFKTSWSASLPALNNSITGSVTL